MDNLDNWKTRTPEDDFIDPDDERCAHCEAPDTSYLGVYCSKDCFEADMM